MSRPKGNFYVLESVDYLNEPDLGEESKAIDAERAARLKSAMLQFVVTMKNMALYPQTNKTNIEAVNSLFLWLNEYLSNNNSLVLEVAKDQLLADDGAVVYQEKPTDQIIAGPLFRDGIQAISFEYGLTEKELRTFLDVLLKFRNVDSDEEDLVASLWEASLNHIRYIISSEYEQVDSEFELTSLKVAKPPTGARDVDAPFNQEALSPMASEGGSPVSKPIASLFALAESTTFFGSTSTGMGQGAVSKGAMSSDQSNPADPQNLDGITPGGEVAYSGIDFAGDNTDSQSDGGEMDSTGFNPLDARHSGNYDDNFEGTFNDQEDSFSKLTAAKKAREEDENAEPWGSQEANGEAANGDDEEAELDIDMSSVAEAFRDMSQRDIEAGEPEKPTNPLTLELLEQRPAAEGPELEERLKNWGLSGREVKQIAALLKWDESRNFSFDTLEIINVLMGSGLIDESNINLISLFLANEIKSSLKKVDLKYLNNFYQGVKDRAAAGNTLEATLLRDLQRKIDSSETLNVLVDPGPTEEAISVGFEDLRYCLYQLSSIGIHTLTSLLPKIANQKLWGLVIELVAYDLLNSGPRTSDIVSRLNDRALNQLIRLLQGNVKKLSSQFLNALTRHKSATVRETVARTILEHDPDSFHHLCAHMVLDTDPSVLRLVRPAISTRRNTLVEGYLFNFLRNSYSNDRHDDDRQLLDCYQIYGKCASPTAVPFLEEVLMKKDFKTFLSRSIDQHKLGAALALFFMPPSSGAEDVLNKASRSSFRNVRQAYAEARKIYYG
ncbi:MAG: hypothetical protein LBF38_02885 [Deltaproteobacteria bacterium]|jgi:hypothetical protein|nr:hypothetical protein [Deltaproteobacteria bacterium]